MNCEEEKEIKELEEEVSSIAQSLLKRKIKWTEKELGYLIDASLGTPNHEHFPHGTKLNKLIMCVSCLECAKVSNRASSQAYNILSAQKWLERFKQNKKIFPKPKA